MTTPTARPTPLAHLERETVPDRQFAARLRAELTRTGGVKVASAQPVDLVSWKTSGRVGTRRRLLDLAAVAALLLAMIGGLASTTQNSSAPATPTTIPAPQSELPTVQSGGTAARDNQYPGPAPVSGTPELVWQLPGGAGASYFPTLMSGNYLYAVRSDDEAGFYRQLTAFVAADGTVIWQRLVLGGSELAATSLGVVALIAPEGAETTPTNAKNPPYNVALLDRDTGQTKWEVDRVIDGKADAFGYRIMVEGDTLYLTDNSGFIVALDLASGTEQWTYSWKRELASGISDQICWALSDDCTSRSTYPLSVAATANTIFVADAATMTIRAIDTQSGSERWIRDSLDVQLETTVIAPFGILATKPDNVVYSVVQSTADFSSALPSQFVLNGATGDIVSSLANFSSPILASDGQLLFGEMMIGDQFTVAATDSLNGELTWYVPVTGGSVIGYLASDQTVVYQEYDAPRRTWGLDAKTGAIKWEVAQGANTCQITLPLSAAGLAVCWGASDGPVVANIKPTDNESIEASPIAVDEPVGPAVVNADATGSGQIRGLPISDAAYEPVWTVDGAVQTEDPYQSIFRYNVYSTSSADDQGLVDLAARDLGTGKVIWEAPIPQFTPYIVTNKGVVTLVRDRIDATILRPAIISLTGGEIVKLSNAAFAVPAAWGQIHVIVTGNKIVVSDITGHIAAIDFSSGQQRWASDYDRVLAPGLTMEPDCNGCMFVRNSIAPFVVSDGATIYISDLLTATITALDAKSGSLKWSRNLLEIVPAEEFLFAYTVATSRGPLVMITHYPVDSEIPAEVLMLWSAVDGTEIWSNETLLGQGGPALTDHDTFYFAVSKSTLVGTPVPSDELCCAVAEFSLEDGSLVWQQPDDEPRKVIGYLTKWDQVITMDWGDSIIGDEQIQGVDAQTHEVMWTFSLESEDCASVLFPVGPSGVIMCAGSTGHPSILAPETD